MDSRLQNTNHHVRCTSGVINAADMTHSRRCDSLKSHQSLHQPQQQHTPLISPFLQVTTPDYRTSLCNITLFISVCLCLSCISTHQCDFHLRGGCQVYEHTTCAGWRVFAATTFQHACVQQIRDVMWSSPPCACRIHVLIWLLCGDTVHWSVQLHL